MTLWQRLKARCFRLWLALSTGIPDSLHDFTIDDEDRTGDHR